MRTTAWAVGFLALAGVIAGCGGGGGSSSGGSGGSGGSTASGGGTSGSGGGTTGSGGGMVQMIAPPIVDLRADVNRDGVLDVTGALDDATEEAWTPDAGAILLANLDDDDARCAKTGTDLELAKCFDGADQIINGDADLEDLAPLKVLPWPKAPDTATATLSVSSAAAPRVRIFRPVQGATDLSSWQMWSEFNPETDTLSAADLRSGLDLRIEAKDLVRDRAVWDGMVGLVLTVKTGKADGSAGSPGVWDGGEKYEEILQVDQVLMRVAPLLTFSHITEIETAYATAFPDRDSVDFRNGLQAALTLGNVAAPLVGLQTDFDGNGPDQWAQDFFETGYMTMPGKSGPHTMRVGIRSANVYGGSPSDPLRPAGKIIYSTLRGHDIGTVQQFSPGASTEDTLNSFGNLETIPPYSLGGVNYPLGRIIRGNVPSYHPDQSFVKMMESQAIQPPVYVDTSWLLVGHIDETVSFLPVNSPRGWILLINDARLAKKMLEDQVTAGNGSAIMFPGQQTYNAQGTAYVSAARTINQVLADTALMAESATAAAAVDAQLDIIKTATGLTDAEIIRVPYLHEKVMGVALAYQPGTANGLLVNGKVFAPPATHGPIIGGKDIFKVQLEDALQPFGVSVSWVEDWYLYHINAGEVHCGSNAARKIPSTMWWETGR